MGCNVLLQALFTLIGSTCFTSELGIQRMRLCNLQLLCQLGDCVHNTSLDHSFVSCCSNWGKEGEIIMQCS